MRSAFSDEPLSTQALAVTVFLLASLGMSLVFKWLFQGGAWLLKRFRRWMRPRYHMEIYINGIPVKPTQVGPDRYVYEDGNVRLVVRGEQ